MNSNKFSLIEWFNENSETCDGTKNYTSHKRFFSIMEMDESTSIYHDNLHLLHY